MSIKVSACVITYNHAAYIRDCLKAAVNQVLDFKYEIVIGDDCSNDETSEICVEYATQYPNLIRYYRREENLGMQGNWLQTLKDCRGEYIALCEGDDYWTNRYKLQEQINILQDDIKLVACFSDAIVFNDSKSESPFCSKSLSQGKVPSEMIIKSGGGLYPTASIVFKSSCFEPELISNYTNLAPDDLLILVLALTGEIYYFNRVTCVYRKVNSGVYSSIRNKPKELIKYKKKTIFELNNFAETFNGGSCQLYLKSRILKERLFLYRHGYRSIKLMTEIGVLNLLKHYVRFIFNLIRLT